MTSRVLATTTVDDDTDIGRAATVVATDVSTGSGGGAVVEMEMGVAADVDVDTAAAETATVVVVVVADVGAEVVADLFGDDAVAGESLLAVSPQPLISTTATTAAPRR